MMLKWSRPLSLLFILSLMAVSTACGEATSEEPAATDDQHPDSKTDAADATNQGKADWPFDICERNSWYGDQACDWFCPETDPDCDLEPLGDEPAGEPTRHPIVLAHGFMGSDSNIWSYYGVVEALESDGHRVYEAEVPPFDGVATRATILGERVDAVLSASGADKVNLIAHSMGGLDARYLVASLDFDDRVASVTTIASPHQGTRLADVYLGLMPQAADAAVDALARAVGGSFSEVADEADVRAAMESIAESNIDDFNANNPDAPGVYYQSWAGVSSVVGVRVGGIEEACENKMLMHDGTIDHMHKLLWGMAAIVAGTDLTLNDGMVTTESARWGDFRGCIPADHLDQIGQLKKEAPDPHTGFDHRRFYRNIAFDLHELGY